MFDGYAGWDPEARFKIRIVCARPYHALFMHNMLIRPTEEELHGELVGGCVEGAPYAHSMHACHAAGPPKGCCSLPS